MDKTIELKTKFFYEGSKFNNEFLDDVKTVLIKLPDETARNINDFYKSKKLFKPTRKTHIKLLSEKVNYIPHEIYTLLSILSFLIQSIEDEETIFELFNDALQIGQIDPDQYKSITSKLNLLDVLIPQFIKYIKSKSVSYWGAPTLSACAYSADLRLQTSRPYKANDDNYSPSFEKFIPIGLLEIEISKHTNKESFSFQMNLEELQHLKNIICAVEKELILLTSLVKNFNKEDKE